MHRVSETPSAPAMSPADLQVTPGEGLHDALYLHRPPNPSAHPLSDKLLSPETLALCGRRQAMPGRTALGPLVPLTAM